MAVDNRPDFIRYYLQFPPVTRTLLTIVVITSISIQLGIISSSLYSILEIVFRFFYAGWGLRLLVTLITCTQIPRVMADDSVSAKFSS